MPRSVDFSANENSGVGVWVRWVRTWCCLKSLHRDEVGGKSGFGQRAGLKILRHSGRRKISLLQLGIFVGNWENALVDATRWNGRDGCYG